MEKAVKKKLQKYSYFAGWVLVPVSIGLMIFGDIFDNEILNIIGWCFIPVITALYFASGDIRLEYERRWRALPQKYIVLPVIVVLLTADILFFIFMPLIAALMFSGVVTINGLIGLVLGLYVNKKRDLRDGIDQ